MYNIKRIILLIKTLVMFPFYKEIHISDVVCSGDFITRKYVQLGKHVWIGRNVRIEGITKYNCTLFTPNIVINDCVSIQQNLHLTCANYIKIGKNTAISANVTITDINHTYVDIDKPIERQDIEVSFVEIGEDCKIYNNVVILPGVTIGKHVTIGANSVVNKDIPSYCVAAGIPAKVIKKYNSLTNCWEKQ